MTEESRKNCIYHVSGHCRHPDMYGRNCLKLIRLYNCPKDNLLGGVVWGE